MRSYKALEQPTDHSYTATAAVRYNVGTPQRRRRYHQQGRPPPPPCPHFCVHQTFQTLWGVNQIGGKGPDIDGVINVCSVYVFHRTPIRSFPDLPRDRSLEGSVQVNSFFEFVLPVDVKPPPAHPRSCNNARSHCSRLPLWKKPKLQ